MTGRKTLNLRDTSDSDEAPALNKKGRGWEISEKRLDALHDRAREMKRFAKPAHKALAKRFADADMGRYTFKRFAVVGSAIVDFNCHNLGMAIIIEEAEDDEAISKRRDKSLETVGIRVMRIKAADILEDIDPVLKRITAGMRMRIADKREAARAHREANPNQDYPTRRDESRTGYGSRSEPRKNHSDEAGEQARPKQEGSGPSADETQDTQAEGAGATDAGQAENDQIDNERADNAEN